MPAPRRRNQLLAILAIFALLCAHFGTARATDITTVDGDMQECSQLKDLDSNINVEDLIVGSSNNPDEPLYNFRRDSYYFCGDDAPPYLRCKCGISSVCHDKEDPWGRNMGECGCCTSWVIILFVIFALVIVIVLVGGLYACMCHGTWLYDGFPQPLMPLLPQRSATIIAPASFPLPENAFRPYRSSDFVSSDDPATIAGSIAAAVLEPNEGLHRRRRHRDRNANGNGSNAGGSNAGHNAITQRHRANISVQMSQSARRPLMASPMGDSSGSMAGPAPVNPPLPFTSAPGSSEGGTRPGADSRPPQTYSPTNSDDGRNGREMTSRPPPTTLPPVITSPVGAGPSGVADDIDLDPSL